MSKTIFVEWNGCGFWAYDVGVALFVKHLIDVAVEDSAFDEVWLQESVERWRVNAIVSDYGFHLNESWSDEQVAVVRRLLSRTCEEVSGYREFSAVDAGGWGVLDGQGIDLRGAEQFPAEPVVELGRAIDALLSGDLPAAPEGTWWFFGAESGRRSIAKLR